MYKPAWFNNEAASAALIMWIPIIVFFCLFVWIGLGPVVDRLTAFQHTFAIANPLFPVSQDRANVTQWLITGWWAWLIFGLVGPVIFYSIIVAKRRTDGEVS